MDKTQEDLKKWAILEWQRIYSETLSIVITNDIGTD